MKVLTEGTKIPIKLWWDSDDMGQGWDDVLVQFQNLANLPLAEKWICGMPDFHLGYGMPIGGVLVTQGGVVPNAVGVDIGCGMIAAETDLEAEQFSRDDLEKMRQAIYRRVPVGFKHHDEAQAFPLGLMKWAADNRGGVIGEQYEKAKRQLGTLGGGNHFIELQRAPDGKLWIMLHSGSRNVGKKVCDYYTKIARKYMQDFASAVPDLDLAFLPRSVPEYDAYLAEMNWCLAFAEESRKMILAAVENALQEITRVVVNFDTVVDTHHNFAAMENHYGKNYLVHRKGAVKAQGLVTIPGSMGTASYICQGLEPVESFNTCSHGAGRVIGRKAANRLWAGKHDEAAATMEHVVFGVREGDYDELPFCYKDIDAVIEAQSDLVRPVTRLEPLAVVKG
jgi:tRNA-splicing ligase RtcB